jgi:hypothetical protein
MMNAKRLRVEHISEQNWAMCRERFADIQRIAEHGPSPTEYDTALIRGVFYCVLADLHKRAADANLEGETDQRLGPPP